MPSEDDTFLLEAKRVWKQEIVCSLTVQLIASIRYF